MAKINSQHILRYVMITLLRGYQLLISPVLGQHCRFYPSCSMYGIDAIKHHGIIYGGWLLLKRLSRCHPWAPGGVDPVPVNSKCHSPDSGTK